MKKFLSLMISAVVAVSTFSATVFAADPLFSISVDKTEVAKNEEVVVTLAHVGQDISSVAAYLKYDADVLELVSIYDGYGEEYTSEDADFGMWYSAKKYMGVTVGPGAKGNTVGFLGNLGGETKTIYENSTYAVITLKVIDDTTSSTVVEMYEGWDSASVIQDSDTLADSETITIKSSEPADTNHITIADTGAVTDNVVVWTATLTADLMSNLTATIYKNAKDETGASTALALGEGVTVSGEGDVTLDVTYDTTTANVELVADNVELGLANGNYSDRK